MRSNRPDAKMWWTIPAYAREIVDRLGLVLIGWPCDIAFMNLSQITGLTRIQRLYDRWKNGVMRFVHVADLEPSEARDDPLLTAIRRLGTLRRRPRHDTGGHRDHPV